MYLLALDTSTTTLAITLVQVDSNFVIQKQIDENLISYTQHSQFLLPTIKKLLHKFNITPYDIDYLIYNKGPGSFTGLRIGIASVLALFLANQNLKLIPISSLEMLALSSYAQTNNHLQISLIDARIKEFYIGQYNFDSDTKTENLINYASLNKFLYAHQQYTISMLINTNNLSHKITNQLDLKEILTAEQIKDIIFFETDSKKLISIATKKIKNDQAGITAQKTENILPNYIRNKI